jgi:hypothetical protein
LLHSNFLLTSKFCDGLDIYLTPHRAVHPKTYEGREMPALWCRRFRVSPIQLFKTKLHVLLQVLYDPKEAYFPSLLLARCPVKRACDIFLYYIPSVTEAPLSIDLVGRLKVAFPQLMVGVREVSRRFLRESDIVSLHLPLSKKNHHLKKIALMKRKTILINVGRDGLIDSAALV